MKWHAQERDPEGLRRVVRNGQVLGWRITCGAGTLEVQGPPVNDRRVDEHGKAVPVHEPDPTVPASLAESRGGAAGAASAGFRPGTSARRSRRCSGKTLWIVGDEHRAADGSMRYAWRSSSSFASTAWVDGRRRRD